MKCPKCEVVALTMADRNGVEIDYCSVCRGVWLDRGELDKIIERSNFPAAVSERPPANFDDRRAKGRYDDDDEDDYRGRRKKRGGFLGELFDF